jgi:hypothetical protein
MMPALAMNLMVAMAAPGNGPEMVSWEVEQGLDLRGRWEGVYCYEGYAPSDFWLDARDAGPRGGISTSPFELVDEGEGRLRLTWADRYLGIYRQEGDQLMLCFGNVEEGRPTSFRTGNGQWLLILHRVKPRQ